MVRGRDRLLPVRAVAGAGVAGASAGPPRHRRADGRWLRRPSHRAPRTTATEERCAGGVRVGAPFRRPPGERVAARRRSSRARATSTRPRSPARACPSPRARATRSSPARSTATARSKSSVTQAGAATRRWPASSAWSARPSRARARRSSGSRSFARVYTPASWCSRWPSLLVPPLFFGGAWRTWFYRALVLLVIACPCALVISTPVSIVAGARRGRPQRRADQGRRVSRNAGASEGHRVRQDRAP